MTRKVWMAMAIACATTAAIGAQSGSTATGKGVDDPSNVTVTGCLQDSSRGASGSTASSGYILANAMMGNRSMTGSSSTAGTTPVSTTGTTAGTTSETTAPAPTGATAGTTGTTGTTTAAGAMSAGHGTSYVLEGRDSELKDHVGHQIEVTGTVEPHDNMKSSTATSTTTSGSASGTTESAAQRLKVASVRMIAADCPAK